MTTIARFTLSEYVNGNKRPYDSYSGGHDWDAGIAPERAASLAIKGDPSLVQATEAHLLDVAPQLDTDPTPAWAPSVAGSRVDIGSHLAGNPRSMRRRTTVNREQARHVNVYTEVGCFANTSAETLLMRGATILALLESFQARRINVDLYLTHNATAHKADDNDLLTVIALDSKPLDLSVSGFALGHPAFVRGVMFHRAKEWGYSGTVSRYYDKSNPECPTYISRIRSLLNMGPHDVYIPRLAPRDPLADNPKEWLRKVLS